jgi:hypothetical protein
MDRRDFRDVEVRRAFLEELATIQRIALTSSRSVRHDVTNAIGAARNALVMIAESVSDDAVTRFADIAERNRRQAWLLVGQPLADVRDVLDRRDERDDLGREREREDGNALGF